MAKPITPYQHAVRYGEYESWCARTGHMMACYRRRGRLYRSDRKRRISARALRAQGWLPADEYIESRRGPEANGREATQ